VQFNFLIAKKHKNTGYIGIRLRRNLLFCSYFNQKIGNLFSSVNFPNFSFLLQKIHQIFHMKKLKKIPFGVWSFVWTSALSFFFSCFLAEYFSFIYLFI
jgi:hypothetical protein